MHRKQRHSQIDDFHILSRHKAADRPAAANLDLRRLCLPRYALPVQYPSDHCYELGVRIESSAIALDCDAVPEPRRIRRLAGLFLKDRIYTVIRVCGDDLRGAKRTPEIKFTVGAASL